MKGLDRITERIEQDAKQKAEAIIKQAEESAAQLMAEASRECEAEVALIDKKADTDAEQLVQSARMSMEFERKRNLLTKKQEIISHVFNTALERLLGMPGDDYTKLLAATALRAVTDGEGGELLLNPSDRDKHGAAVVDMVNASLMGDKISSAADVVKEVLSGLKGGKLPSIAKLAEDMTSAVTGKPITLSDDTANIAGGLIIRRGSIELNCAFDVAVHMMAEKSAHEVADVLFSKGA